MQLIIVLLIIYLIIRYIKREDVKNNENENIVNSKSNLKKIFYGILLFVPLFIMYYFIVAMISMLIIAVITRADGAWAYALILGLSTSPILTVITIMKILNRK